MEDVSREPAACLAPFTHGRAVLNRRSEIIRQDRLNRAKLEIAERIRCVCTEMPAEEFDVLVSHMAEVQIKYTLRRSGDLFPDGGDRREPN